MTADTTEVITTVRVYNPAPISIQVKSAICDIVMNDINMGQAEVEGILIKRKAESPIQVATKITNAKLLDFWVEHIKRKERSTIVIKSKVTIDLKVREYSHSFKIEKPVETDILSELRKIEPLTIEKKTTLPIINKEITAFKITLKSRSGSWGTVTRETTQLGLTAVIKNENLYPLPVPKIAYEISLNEVLLASGETDSIHLILPKTEIELNEIINLNTSRMDKQLASHINRGETSSFHLIFTLMLELPEQAVSLFHQEKLSYKILDESFSFKTDLLGNQ